MSGETATIHTDGAARGNPGPAAVAYVIARPDQLGNDALDGRPIGAIPVTAARSAPAARSKPRKRAAAARNPAVDEQAIGCLRSVATAWRQNGANSPTPEQVWEQLWSVLEDG